MLLCARNVVITCHVSPDGDALGSTTALCSVLRALGKDATVVTADCPPKSLQFLPGVREIITATRSPERAQDLIAKADLVLTEKLPAWLRAHTKKELSFSFCSGTEFPEDLSSWALVLHCGGCMLNEREVRYRMKCARDQGVPMTNYGVAIAHMHGILRRSIAMFPHLLAEFSEL